MCSLGRKKPRIGRKSKRLSGFWSGEFLAEQNEVCCKTVQKRFKSFFFEGVSWPRVAKTVIKKKGLRKRGRMKRKCMRGEEKRL